MAPVAGLWVAGTVAAVCGWLYWPYNSARNAAADTGALLVLAVAAATGPVLVPVAGVFLAIWWVVRAAASTRFDIAGPKAASFALVLLAGMVCQGAGLWWALPVICADTLIEVLRRAGRIQVVAVNAAGGLQGNSLHFGWVQMAGVFIGLDCFFTGPWAFGAVAVVICLYGVVLSASRSAAIGTATGLVVLAPAMAVPLAVAGLAYAFDFGRGWQPGRGASWRHRWQIWALVVPALRARWLDGLGPDHLKLHINAWRLARASAAFNPFRKAHNELVQIVADCGVIGLAGWAAVWVPAIFNGILVRPALGAGLCALAAAGLFFHGWHVASVRVLAALMLGACWAGPAVTAGPAVAAAVAAGYPAMVWHLARLRAMVLVHRAAQPDGAAALAAAGRVLPKDTLINCLLARACLTHGFDDKAAVYAARAAEWFDGEVLWSSVLAIRAQAQREATTLSAMLARDAKRYQQHGG